MLGGDFLVLPILLFLVSGFLLFQGLCFRGIVDMNALFLQKFSSFNMLVLVREVLGKYCLLLGVLGIAIALFLFLGRRSDKMEIKTGGSFWTILVFYSIIALFTII